MSDNNLIQINDFSPWDGIDAFDPGEAACLLAGISPDMKESEYPSYLNNMIEELVRIAGERELREDFHFQRPYSQIFIEDMEDHCFRNGFRSKFLSYRENKKNGSGHLKEIQRMKNELKEYKSQLENLLAENQKIKFETQGHCMNHEHPLFAPELETAVAVWVSLFSERTEVKEKGKNARKLIEGWIKENRTGLSKEAIERIKTVANPGNQKRGGAPKTEI